MNIYIREHKFFFFFLRRTIYILHTSWESWDPMVKWSFFLIRERIIRLTNLTR